MGYDIKQVIVVRSDLKMRRGKECAQSSHASMAFLSRAVQPFFGGYFHRLWMAILGRSLPISDVAVEWFRSSFAKVVCRCDGEEELLDIERRAKEAGLVCHLITDSGRTEFAGIPTKTCLAIGPDYSDKIDKITGNLRLY